MEREKIPLPSVIAGLLYFVGMPALLMLGGGDVSWWQGWVFVAISLLFTILSRALIARVHPDLIRERSQFREKRGIKEWDKLLAPLVALWLPLAYFLLAAMDKRFGWSSPLPMWVNIVAIIFIISGYLVSAWAMVENKFFSANVRVQHDRNQTVIESGPYSWVRHPGYAGGLMVAIMFPLLLNSLWAYLVIFPFVVLVLLRTYLEDKTLIKELEGYASYTNRTKYRVVPGIW